MNISFLHTASSHQNRFDQIIDSFGYEVDVAHFVNEQLLWAAAMTNEPDQHAFAEQIKQIRQQRTGIIICTCSTYGPLCNEEEMVYRIDLPVARFLTANYVVIGVAYTVGFTKVASFQLLEDQAKAQGKTIHLVDINCSDHWHYFENGRMSKYEQEIANTIRKQADDLAAVFLAQASMQGAVQYLMDAPFPVLSSPAFGVKYYLDQQQTSS